MKPWSGSQLDPDQMGLDWTRPQTLKEGHAGPGGTGLSPHWAFWGGGVGGASERRPPPPRCLRCAGDSTQCERCDGLNSLPA